MKTIASITMSLDGFIAGPNISQEHPLGENGPLLHNWLFSESTAADKKILTGLVESTGAVILGSRTYTTAIDGVWDGNSPFDAPAFVLASKHPITEKPGFTFIKDGIISALSKAQSVAEGKDIWVMGGADTIQQFLEENLLDEIHIHIAPILLGKGTLLFSQSTLKPTALIKMNTIETKGATHLFYKIVK